MNNRKHLDVLTPNEINLVVGCYYSYGAMIGTFLSTCYVWGSMVSIESVVESWWFPCSSLIRPYLKIQSVVPIIGGMVGDAIENTIWETVSLIGGFLPNKDVKKQELKNGKYNDR
jgi:hypothetical protein